MRNKHSPVVGLGLGRALALGLALTACGGKILDEGRSGAAGAAGAASAAPSGGFGDDTTRSSDDQEPVPVLLPGLQQPDGKSSVADACATICERNGKCGAWQSDCYERCTDDLRSSSSCAGEASAYLHCYADNLESCTQVPPVCEPAYCAFRRCEGKSGPSYCR
jgi:hypothetical protein